MFSNNNDRSFGNGQYVPQNPYFENTLYTNVYVHICICTYVAYFELK
jgi:hypothetical protein